MKQIYTLGHGGKHRDTTDAARWRYTTTQVAANIQSAFPRMSRSIAITHAEDETAAAFQQMNRNERNF